MDFYRVLSRYYNELFPLSDECTSFMLEHKGRGDSLLDAGCGTGELVIAMQEKGLDARGFDLDEGMILSAASAAKQRGLLGNDLFRITGLERMKEFYGDGSFDTVTCLGNTLVHVPFNRQFHFLQDAWNMLKPGGVLILQILNYNTVVHDRVPFSVIDTEHCEFTRTYVSGDSPEKLIFHTELEEKKSGEVYRSSIDHYPLYPETLMASLSMAGFAGWETWGSYSGESAGEGRLPLIVTASRD